MRRQCDRVPDGDLVAYLANPEDESLRAVHEHVGGCEECAAELRAWQGLRGDLLIDDVGDSEDHPVEENLVAYSDDPESLGPALRTEIQAHLSGCAACRDEMKVFAGVRIERAAAAEIAHELGAVEEPEPEADFDVEFGEEDSDGSASDSIPHPAVIEATSWGQRVRHPAFAFALFLLLTVPVLGLLTIERGGVPQATPVIMGSGPEMEIDPITLTARPIRPHADSIGLQAQLRAESIPPAQSADAAMELASAHRDLARPERDAVAAAEKGEGAAASAATAASTEKFVDQVRAVEKSGAVESERALEGALASYKESAAPASPPAGLDPRPPSQSATEQVLAPEQLMAMLETERRVAEMRRRSIEIPDAPEDHVRTGAAVIETFSDDDAASADEEGYRGDDEGTPRTAMVDPESMILGVRELGTAPVRGAMIGMPDTRSGTRPPIAASPSKHRMLGKTRIHFVRGSSYVFTQDEVSRGAEVRFPIPVVDGRAEEVEARLVEVGTNRVLTKTYSPKGDGLQASPSVSLDVPSGWFSPGRYSVILRSRTAGAAGSEDLDSAVDEAQAGQGAERAELAESNESVASARAAASAAVTESSINIKVLASPTVRSEVPAAVPAVE